MKERELNEQAAQEMALEKTITLRKPVELGGVTYDTLDLREPTAGELAKASNAGNHIDMGIAMISSIAKVPKGAVEKLCQRDFQEATDFLGGFGDDGLTTGETSSLS